MYHIQDEQEFREALLHQNLQHISGTILFKDGTSVALNDSNLLGFPRIDTRIITDSETFNISEMYIGTLEFEFLTTNISETQLLGAEVSLQVQVDLDSGQRSWPVPMGVWDIVSAPVLTDKSRKITAYDHIARLAAPLGDSSASGTIWFSQVITRIRNIAGITFSQSFDDLNALDPDIQVSEIYPVSYHYAPTCWLEVQYIAQYLGCYVVATRDGKIEFRRYNLDTPVKTITADERFNAQVGGEAFFVRGFGYTDKYGRTVESLAPQMTENEAKIYIPQENVFAIDVVGDNYESYYLSLLRPLKDEFAMKGWYPGYIDYYGDPTLDVGDTVLLTGGVAGQGLRKFLICQNSWQFRAPQTLVSGGAPRVGNTIIASSSGSGNGVYTNTTITKNIILAQFKTYKGMLFDIPRTAAKCKFAASEQTAGFITFTMTLLGSGSVDILLDNIPLYPSFECSGTISVTLPTMINGSSHTAEILITGTDELSAIQGSVWSQDISPIAITIDETDWEYETDVQSSTITGYTGSDSLLYIPDMLGLRKVIAIGEGAIADNIDILAVYIPDGVETIE